MSSSPFIQFSLRVMLVCGSLSAGAAQAQQSPIELTQQMLNATVEFLNSLDASQRNTAIFGFDDEERLNWHFIPRERQGIPLKALNENQLKAANALLRNFLSAKGIQKSESIRGLESVLAQIEQNGRFVRDPDLYYLTVFGNPSLEGSWAVRYEGHHQAFNWTFVGGTGIASTPQFFGSNPAEVRTGPQQGLRVLAAEEDMARELVTSMTEAQTSVAVLSGEAPGDIFTGAEKQVTQLEQTGIGYGALNPAQQELLVELINEVAAVQTDLVLAERLRLIREQGLDNIKFAWIGSTERGAPHYYRVQGPSFLIEYDNTQNEANHIHLVWRDFEGDFGRDLIRQHYDSVAAQHGPGHQH